MPEIQIWNDFKAGWRPSDDPLNGDPSGLQIMNNVERSPNGSLNLIGGTTVVRTLAGAAVGMFSKTLSGTKIRYFVLASGAIYRDGTNIATASGAVSLAGFGAGYGYVFITAGNKRIADSGSGSPIDLYIEAPATAPIHTGVAKATLAVNGDYTDTGMCDLVNSEGTITYRDAVQVNMDTDSSTFRAVLESIIAVLPAAPLDANVLSGGTVGTEEDFISFSFQCENPFELDSVAVQFILDPNTGTVGSQYENYYEYIWYNSKNADSPFSQGLNSYSSLGAKRGNFARKGQGLAYPWNINSVKIIVTCTAEIAVAVFNITVNGGGPAQLFGDIQWVQVNVKTSDAFQTRSIAGPASVPIRINGSAAEITPVDPADEGADEGWIYRRGGKLGSTWYLEKVVTDDTPYEVDMSDDDLLEPGVPTLDPLVSTISPSVLVDDIYAIIGPIEGRMLYFTFKEIIFSEQESPGTFNRQQVRKYSGELGEKFMWACQAGPSVVMVGTSKDIYRLEGTFQTLPDGFIDVFFTPLGVSSPPISYDVCRKDGGVCYMAADGWRWTFPSGESRSLVSDKTDVLYKDFYTSAYNPANLLPFGSARYSCAVVKDTLYGIVQVVGGTRRVEAFDFRDQTWREINQNPSLLCREDDESLLSYTGDDNNVRLMNVQTPNKLLDGATQQTIDILSSRFVGGAIHNRKDVYVVKMNVYTNNVALTFTLAHDTGVAFSTTFSSNSLNTQVSIDISSLGQIKNWSFRISGQCPDFILRNISIEFDVRPPQLPYLFIQATNYGVVGRKRLPAIPFTIDTLGNQVQLIPIKDGTSQTALTFTTSRKQSLEYHFGSTTGIDYAFIVRVTSGGLFEWFGFEGSFGNLMKLPELTRYQRSQENNFGTNAPKTVTSWTFQIACLGVQVVAILYGDNGTVLGTLNCNGTEADTYTMYFTLASATSNVDYFHTFSSTGDFEVYDNGMNANGLKFSYVFKKPTKLIQVGPIELFRYGVIRKLLFRVRTTGTSLSVRVTLDNQSPATYSIVAVANKELVYDLPMPKTTGGSILTVDIYSDDIFYPNSLRIQHTVGGRDTEQEWRLEGAN